MSTQTSNLSPEVLENFAVISRVSSVISLVAVLFVLFSYAASTSFHKPINRLVIYASIGNILTNVATIMSRSHIDNPHDPLCKMQAFFIQMFMPADAYWTLAMALNVYLTFYHKYDKYQLRRLEYYYLGICYGLPIAPAVTFLFIHSEQKGRMYGNATLWCWISNSWDVLRIATFYGPVWTIIIITMLIYARAGKDIWNKRQDLKKLITPISQPTGSDDPFVSVSVDRGIQRRIDVYINRENAPMPTYSPTGSARSRDPRVIEYPLSEEQKANTPIFTTMISSGLSSPGNFEDFISPTKTGMRHNVKNFVTTVTCRGPPAQLSSPPRPVTNGSQAHISTPGRKEQAFNHNFAIWHYTKVSLLFFCAMMITWIPSSANRVYSVIHGPNHISVGLSYASALVLPLQGLWNAVIYIKTSFAACRELWQNTKAGRPFVKSELHLYLHWRFWEKKKRSMYSMQDDREHHGSSGIIMRTANNPNPQARDDYGADEGPSSPELKTPSRPGSSKESGGASLTSS